MSGGVTIFSDRLRQLRKQHKLSQDALAKQLFVSQQSVAKWENGKITPNPETLSKIADIFDVSTDYLIGRINQEEPTPEEWDSLTDMQKDIIVLMGNMSQEQQKDLLEHAEYQFWRATHKKPQQ